MKKANQYSFTNVRKEEILPPSLREVPEDDEELDKELAEDAMVYTLDDNKVVEEYCFDGGSSTLYLNNGDGTFAKVFDTLHDEDSYLYAIYRPHGVYMMESKNRCVISAFYMTAEDFEKFDSMQNQKRMRLFSPIQNFKLDHFLGMHAVPLVIDGKTINEFAPNYQFLKGLFMRYYMASQYIPANAVIHDISEIITHYLATGQLNDYALISHWIRLGNFQELCVSSYGIVGDFVADPAHTDLRELLETLQRNSKNISHLLDMYLKEELER